MATLTIVRPGLLTTVQDRGRWGFQSSGVPVCGAMDLYSLSAANALIGNGPDAAALEVTLMGPQIEFDAPTAFAVTGAEFRLTLNETPIAMNAAVNAGPGSCLRFGERMRGARAYFAVAGGIRVPPVLNSRSTHVLCGMGGHEGRALRGGDVLAIGAKGEGRGAIAPYPSPLAPSLPNGGATLRVLEGPHAIGLAGLRFKVSPQSNRMGYRLEGPAIADASGELISSPVPMGALQLPPKGQPILLMADHATVGGYAVAATVISADLPIAGQLAPGDWIEFAPCSFEVADQALRARERALDGKAS